MSYIIIHEADYHNCRVPTGETWTWDYWTDEKPHDFDYSLVHENGVKCTWWIEVDLPQVIIDLHTHGDELGSAKLGGLISGVMYQWIAENMEPKCLKRYPLSA